MPDLTDLTDDLRVTNETPESIKARLLADTNAGIDPNDPAYADTIPGSFWDDLEGAGCLEWDRLYDRLNEAVAAAIPSLSFGAFLDAWAESLGLSRNDAAPAGGFVRFSGPDGPVIATGTQVSTEQTSADADAVTFVTIGGGTIDVTGVLDLAVSALSAGSEGNVPANTVTIPDTPLPDGVTVTNPSAMTGGADIETDEALQKRILRKLSGAGGGGNEDDYINWGLDYPGVGFVTVQANTPSVGHVTVLITDLDNNPSPPAAIAGLQERLDPSSAPTQGKGLAPIGATVHVDTPTSLAIVVAAVVELETGYTLDGAGGTVAVGDEIEASLGRYIDSLPVGADVVYNKALAAVVDVLGVADATSLTLNAGSADVAVAATEVASMTRPIGLTV